MPWSRLGTGLLLALVGVLIGKYLAFGADSWTFRGGVAGYGGLALILGSVAGWIFLPTWWRNL